MIGGRDGGSSFDSPDSHLYYSYLINNHMTDRPYEDYFPHDPDVTPFQQVCVCVHCVVAYYYHHCHTYPILSYPILSYPIYI